MDLFLSYVPDEGDNLDPVLNILDETGYAVQYDYETITQPDWQGAIVNRMKQTNALLAILTPQTVQSEWCRWTITIAKHLQKPIIAVRLRGDDTPLALQQTLQYDFTTEDESILAVFKQSLRKMHTAQRKSVPTKQPVATTPEPTRQTDEYRTVESMLTNGNQNRETDEFPALEGLPRGSQKDSETRETYDTNRQIFFMIQPLVADASTIYSPSLSPQDEVIPTWQTIYDAHLCVFNLSLIDTQGWLEIGIAVALGKRVLLVAEEAEPLPRVLEQYNILRYQDVADLEPKLERLRDNGYFSIEDNTNGQCHLCNSINCPALDRRVDNQSYKVITDSRMLWQGLLGTIRATIHDIATANPAYSSDRAPSVCDLRASIIESKFILTHLDFVQNPINLIYLGLAIGHTKPWLMLYQRGTKLPTLLDAIEKLEDNGIETFKEEQVEQVQDFLDAIYGTRTNSSKPGTAEQFEWQNLATKAKGQLPNAQDSNTEMLKGKLTIVQLDGEQVIEKFNLPDEDGILTFGREGGEAQVILESRFASLNHFRIYESAGRFFVEDLGSRNGTYHNGTLLRRNTPTELYLEDMVMAAGASFLIWDERPMTHTPQKLGLVKESGTHIYKLRLNVPPPSGLVSLNQGVVLQVMFHNDRGRMKKISFETQSYYPFGQILKTLVTDLELPDGNHYLQYQHQRLKPDNTPMQLNMRPNSLIEITSGVDKVANALNTIMNAIDHCERDLVTEQGQRKYRDGFRYMTFEDMYVAAYRNLYNETPQHLEAERLKGLYCPTCQQPLSPTIKVAIKRR